MTTTTGAIRLATVGTSSIVHRFAAAAAEVPDVELVCAYSRDAARAAETAAALGMPRSTTDWDELLADPEIDALYIARTNLSHVQQSREAIKAGKHVLVEKSAAPTAGQWQRVVDLAADHGVVVLEEMRPAHDPGTAEIIRLLPELGTIRRVSFDYTQRSARYDKVLAGEQVNIFDPALAGGAFYDLGVYAVSQLVQIFGEPYDLMAVEVAIPTGADGSGMFLGLYPDHELGHFVADVSWSKITLTSRPSEIQGERGSLLIDRIDDPRVLTLTNLAGEVTSIEVAKPRDNMTCAIAHFADCVLGRADASPDQGRTVGTLRTMDRVRAKWQRV